MSSEEIQFEFKTFTERKFQNVLNSTDSDDEF